MSFMKFFAKENTLVFDFLDFSLMQTESKFFYPTRNTFKLRTHSKPVSECQLCIYFTFQEKNKISYLTACISYFKIEVKKK